MNVLTKLNGQKTNILGAAALLLVVLNGTGVTDVDMEAFVGILAAMGLTIRHGMKTKA